MNKLLFPSGLASRAIASYTYQRAAASTAFHRTAWRICCLSSSSMMFRTTSSSQQQVVPGQGRSDPNRIAPYLTHLVTHHGQTTLIPPQNAGRIRKSPKKTPERARGERRRDGDEPRFNVAAPTTPRGASRRGNNASTRGGRTPAAPPNLPRGKCFQCSRYC